ncbi:cloacin, partial [Enterobacter hormaechei]|nr:cloacin [Enterobacter hormaechei]
MGLRLRLQWYDKETELGEGNEFSSDFGDDAQIMTKDLGLPTKGNVNNGF